MLILKEQLFKSTIVDQVANSNLDGLSFLFSRTICLFIKKQQQQQKSEIILLFQFGSSLLEIDSVSVRYNFTNLVVSTFQYQ